MNDETKELEDKILSLLDVIEQQKKKINDKEIQLLKVKSYMGNENFNEIQHLMRNR